MVIFNALLIGFAIHIIATEVRKLGTESNMFSSLILDKEYDFNAEDVMPLHVAQWFFVPDVYDRIREYQTRAADDAEALKHPVPGRLIPRSFEEMTWQDNKFVEEYLCRHTSVYFLQQSVFDMVGKPAWSEQIYFNFKCQLMYFAND